MSNVWISIKEAWVLYDSPMTLDTFRRKLCCPGGILAERGGLREPHGHNRRAVMVSRLVIVNLVDEEQRRAG